MGRWFVKCKRKYQVQVQKIDFMKNGFFLFIICFILVSCNTQNSYEILDEAETLYHEGKLDESLEKVDLALNSITSSCATAIFEIADRGSLLKYQIHTVNSNYKLARRSIEFMSSSPLKDSLTIVSYQAEFGKSYFEKIMDKSLPNAIVSKNDYTHYAEIPLIDIGQTISFDISFKDYNEYYSMKSEQEAKEEWLSYFINSPTHQLIKEEK